MLSTSRHENTTSHTRVQREEGKCQWRHVLCTSSVALGNTDHIVCHHVQQVLIHLGGVARVPTSDRSEKCTRHAVSVVRVCTVSHQAIGSANRISSSSSRAGRQAQERTRDRAGAPQYSNVACIDKEYRHAFVSGSMERVIITPVVAIASSSRLRALEALDRGTPPPVSWLVLREVPRRRILGLSRSTRSRNAPRLHHQSSIHRGNAEVYGITVHSTTGPLSVAASGPLPLPLQRTSTSLPELGDQSRRFNCSTQSAL